MSGRPPSGRWGWYRLADDVARELVALSGVGPGDLVLDLGAGDGSITRHLVAAGARVVAFELHAARADLLRHRFATVRVVRADVGDLHLPAHPFRVVSNPPFGNVSSLLSRLTAPHSRLIRADLVLPLAVAGRWAERLARGRPAWELQLVRRLPRAAFRPRPRVDCCIVTIAPRPRRRR